MPARLSESYNKQNTGIRNFPGRNPTVYSYKKKAISLHVFSYQEKEVPIYYLWMEKQELMEKFIVKFWYSQKNK